MSEFNYTHPAAVAFTSRNLTGEMHYGFFSVMRNFPEFRYVLEMNGVPLRSVRLEAGPCDPATQCPI